VILGLVRPSHVAKQLEASGTYYIWQQRLSSASTDFGVCYTISWQWWTINWSNLTNIKNINIQLNCYWKLAN